MHRILIDTDPGVDDALAILLAMLSPELHIAAITTVCGNVPVTQATENLLRILKVLEVDTPPHIAQGEARPLVKPLVTATHVHGADGLGNVSRLRNAEGHPRYPPAHIDIALLSGVDLIVETVTQYPEELTLVALGPLTNIATAIRKAPKKMQRLQKILLMGGAFEVDGNVTPTAEFNIFVDPHAAEIVLHANIPIDIAPLDATQQVVLTGERLHAETDKRTDKISQFLKDATHACMEFYRAHVGFWGFHIHDALPIGMLTHPAYFENVAAHVQVETADSLTNGMTIAELRPECPAAHPNASVCVKVAAEAFLDNFFERLQ